MLEFLMGFTMMLSSNVDKYTTATQTGQYAEIVTDPICENGRTWAILGRYGVDNGSKSWYFMQVRSLPGCVTEKAFVDGIVADPYITVIGR